MHSLIAGGFSISGRRFFLHWMRNHVERERIIDADVQRLIRKAIFQAEYDWLLKYFRVSNYVWRLKRMMSRLQDRKVRP